MKKFLLLLILLLLLTGCGEKRETVQGFALDTFISFTTDKKDAKKSREALRLCSEYEKIFSRKDEKSELYAVNKKGEIPTGELFRLIKFGKDFSEKTGGAFDITVSSLSDLWNIKEREVPPTKEETEAALKKTGYEKITLSPFELNDTEIDLGAIAKGYIADKLCEFFKKENTDNVIIDLGGNVLVIGEYTVGVRDPFMPTELFAKITLKDKSAVTSGAYQRYFEYEGKRYHHIIDARSGKCADSGFASVTVISDSSLHADALSTAVFILGEEGFSLAENFGADILAITNDKMIKTTPGFKEKYGLTLYNE